MNNHAVIDEFSDVAWRAMRRALDLAAQAATAGEVPVGAAVYDSLGNIVGDGENRMIRDCDPSAHAEIVALRAAARHCGNYRLPQYHMAISLEPCAMCAGAIFHARLKSVVFAAADTKTGALGGVLSLHQIRQINAHTTTAGGLLADESATLLRDFFAARR